MDNNQNDEQNLTKTFDALNLSPPAVKAKLDLLRLKKKTKSNNQSTGSSTNSSRNTSYSHLPYLDNKETIDYLSITDSIFPILVSDKRAKKQAKARKSVDVDSASFDSPVKEETAEKEEDHFIQVLKKLPIVSDGEEFNEKLTRIQRRDRGGYSSHLERCRSQDTQHLPLSKVQEAKTEDEYRHFKPLSSKFCLENMLDMNEFNKKEMAKSKIKRNDHYDSDRSMSEKKYPRRFSLHIGSNAIMEDLVQENKEIRELPLNFLSGTSSNTSSHHSSPRFKLKVDELDSFKDKRFFEPEDQETIMEESLQEEGTEQHKLLQQAKNKLNNEKEFIKKFIQSEFIEENDSGIRAMNNVEKEFTNLRSDPIQEEGIEEEKQTDAN